MFSLFFPIPFPSRPGIVTAVVSVAHLLKCMYLFTLHVFQYTVRGLEVDTWVRTTESPSTTTHMAKSTHELSILSVSPFHYHRGYHINRRKPQGKSLAHEGKTNRISTSRVMAWLKTDWCGRIWLLLMYFLVMVSCVYFGFILRTRVLTMSDSFLGWFLGLYLK